MKNTRRWRSRQADPYTLDLFEWGRSRDLMSDLAVRRVVQTFGRSPALAAVIAELSGLGGQQDD